MKIVVAPDKFKGSLTGFEFCSAVEEGFLKVSPNVILLKKPLADGGDGTLGVIKHYMGGTVQKLHVQDPLFRTIQASYILSESKDLAFVEMASASGLNLMKPEEQNCMLTSSIGTGQLIIDALKKGVQQIILGIGGSATNDGGMGMATALGFRFIDEHGNELEPIGKNLIAVQQIDASKVIHALKEVTFKVACDVSNPFYGANGAAHIYAAQKGASKEEIVQLDNGLENFASVIQKYYSLDVQEIEGAGAAGGLGAATAIFLKAQLVSGIELIKDIAHFDEAIENADWIITGEGALDLQTSSGKTIAGVLSSAKAKNIKVAALCGKLDISEEEAATLGIDYVDAVSKNAANLQDALANAYDNLVKAAEEFGLSISKK